MRISDWSSDVCSSDLPDRLARAEHQRAGVDIRDIAEALGLGLDKRARRRADAGIVVESPRNRIGRQPDGLRQILKSGLTPPLDYNRHATPPNLNTRTYTPQPLRPDERREWKVMGSKDRSGRD